MSTIPDAPGAPGGIAEEGTAAVSDRPALPATRAPTAPAPATPTAPAPAGRPRRSLARALDPGARYALGVYALTRVMYLAIALLDTVIRGWSLSEELANWDGRWYVLTATSWYPHAIPQIHGAYSTLGFLPLYPMVMWGVGHLLPGAGYLTAGVVVSLVAGAVAVVEINALATQWWGAQPARRAILFFCVFPGSIVFSMVYGEGLMLALVAGAMLALSHRRWVLAGILAGLSTAIEPVALMIIPVCACAALRHMRDRGWADRGAWRALAAPVLSTSGIVATGIFLWRWTGTALASYRAQRNAWDETSTPFALWRDGHRFLVEALHFDTHHPNLDMNMLAAVLGALLLVWCWVLLWRERRNVSVEALLWTAGLTVLTVTSNSVPPNARMLTCMFPAVLALGASREGADQRRLLAITLVLTVAMSIDTFVGTGLRP